jgi:hypothetical protein
MLIGLRMNVFFPFTCEVKYAITRHAPLSARLSALQRLERAGYCASVSVPDSTLPPTSMSASLCLASCALSSTLCARFN